MYVGVYGHMAALTTSNRLWPMVRWGEYGQMVQVPQSIQNMALKMFKNKIAQYSIPKQITLQGVPRAEARASAAEVKMRTDGELRP